MKRLLTLRREEYHLFKKRFGESCYQRLLHFYATQNRWENYQVEISLTLHQHEVDLVLTVGCWLFSTNYNYSFICGEKKDAIELYTFLDNILI